MKIIIVFTFVVYILISSRALGFDSCPAVHCDCEAISSAILKRKCSQRESEIKRECEQNANIPISFCATHGPNATPLALELEIIKTYGNPSLSKIKALERKIDVSFTTIESYFGELPLFVAKKSFGDAFWVLNLIGEEVNNLFALQQHKSAIYEAADKPLAARSNWKQFAPIVNDKVYVAAKRQGDNLLVSHHEANTVTEEKAYRVLAFKLLRIAALGGEITGFSYGKSKQHKNAARLWISSARIASMLADKEEVFTNHVNRVRFYRLQSASRWYRSAYHWLEDNNKSRASQSFEHGSLAYAHSRTVTLVANYKY